jgi:hypothetical protein
MLIFYYVIKHIITNKKCINSFIHYLFPTTKSEKIYVPISGLYLNFISII